MKKRFHVIAVLLLAMLMTAGLSVAAFAAEYTANGTVGDTAVAADTATGNGDATGNTGASADNASSTANNTNASANDARGYTYRVTIYSGKQGVFADKKRVWKQDYHAGDSISISTEDLGFKLTDDKYYVRGFRVTGHDNDETTGIQRLQIDNIDTDVSYELAYGIKGALVSYVVNYVDEDGNALRESDTYYGMPGDKPVVSYRYINGYTPNTYNQAKTLSRDESQNVFTFTYTKGETPSTNRGNGNGTGTTNNGGNNNGGALAPGTAGNPAGTGAAGQDGTNTPAGENIGDNDTPLASGPSQFTDIDDAQTPLGLNGMGTRGKVIVVGSTILVIAGIILILLALLRRKRRDEEEVAAA